MTTTYSQPSKRIVRELALSHAVELLTKRRRHAPLVPEFYVRAVARHLFKAGSHHDRQMASGLSGGRIRSWQRFHRALVGSKSPEDLKICYLAGPEPLNDFQVLTELGVHPHNIWAFESNASIYAAAAKAVGASGFPFLKLFRGKIEQFARDVPTKFDVIYVDACGPLPSRSEKTLRILSTILSHQRLNSPGALITNFSHPDLEDNLQREFFTHLVSNYLYPKDFIEGLAPPGSGYVEGPVAQSLSPDSPPSFRAKVERDFPFFYGQYITRQLFDLASVIVPWVRVCNSMSWNGLFQPPSKSVESHVKPLQSFTRQGTGGDIIVEPGQHPLPWTFCAMKGGGYSGVDPNFPSPHPAINPLVDDWLLQLSGSPEPPVKARAAAEWADLLRGRSSLYTKRFADAVSKVDFRQKMFQFCDVPTSELAFSLLVNQLAFPMHYAVDNVRRWTYTAKQTQMFTDVVVLDECRYIYDWMPTVDLLHHGFDDASQQLAYRFALDGLAKNRRWYNSEYFYGAAVIDQFTDAFEAKALCPREAATRPKKPARCSPRPIFRLLGRMLPCFRGGRTWRQRI